ncbi:MAG: hypothetical protein GW942_01690 [Candidatus Pacebacteria bacterium]|nr:hypothetical protein [Candidatus Paceibacterota bacterium]
MSIEFATEIEKKLDVSPSSSLPDNKLAKEFLEIIRSEDSPSVDSMIRCLLAWQTKKLPRYLVNQKCKVIDDNVSARWSPGFHRLDKGLLKVKERLKGADILDPFAGSGSMMHALLSLGIPATVFLNDMCYLGGQAIVEDENSEPYYYYPQRNLSEYKKIFEEFKHHIPAPNLDKIVGYASENAETLALHGDNSFDIVFTDPPYNKNLPSEGVLGLIKYLSEIQRVSKNGAILLIPQSWLKMLKSSNKFRVEDLTGNVANENSNLKTVFTHVYE